MMSDPSEAPLAVFRRVGPKNKAALRKRDAPRSSSSHSEEDLPTSSSVQKRIAKKRGKMAQTTRRRQSSSERSASETEMLPDVGVSVVYLTAGVKKSGPNDMGATARTEHDTAHDKDAQAQFERIQKQLEEESKGEPGSSKEKIYRGQAMYGATYKTGNARGNASSGLNRLGPIRATQYMRSSVRWDYAPDICKDYKETGFCTFGDSCKFMHDRSDYKHGWEIERDWEEGKLVESKDDEFLVPSSEDEEELPFACYICREEFKSPVMTKCQHYFCEKCAMEKCRTKCAVCGEKTFGQLKMAKTLLKKLKEKKERQETKKESDEESEELPPEAIMENAEEVGSNDVIEDEE